MSEFKHFLMSAQKELPKDVIVHIYALYLISEFGVDVIDYLCRYGNLEMIIYMSFMKNNPKIRFESRNLESAAIYGNLSVIRWFNDNVKSVKFTTEVMDLAAMNGHLHVVKWLNENRTEGCTKWAVNGAILRGHLDVVEWFYENRKDDFVLDSGSVSNAIMSRYLHIIKWINENIPNFEFEYSHIENSRNLDIINYLAENCRDRNLRERLKNLLIEMKSPYYSFYNKYS